MAFKDSLDAIPTSGRSHACRICQLIDEWPDGEADALALAARQGSGLSLRKVAAALEMEGHPGLFHSVKSHRYVCRR
jgi:hypothetical protein